MNVMIINLLNFDKPNLIGVAKKTTSQSNVFSNTFPEFHKVHLNNTGMVVKYKGVEKTIKKSFCKKIEPLEKRIIYYKSLLKYIDSYNIDVIYMRYPLSDPFFIKFLKKCKERKIRILMEVATYPYDSELGNLTLKFDKTNRKKLNKHVDIITTYSNDKEIFGIPTINIWNGVDFEEISIRKTNETNIDNEINLIAVSSMAPWHGYDRFIHGLGDYYKSGGKRKVKLHMVGSGKLIQEYKKLLKEYGIEEYIIFYGSKSGKELDEVYDKSDIAIESLGVHRKNIYISSSLKSREYGAKGLPIVTSCKIDYIPEVYKYQLNVLADERSIDINKVIEFYDTVYGENISSRDVAEEIREFAKGRVDISITMKPVIDYIRENLK